MVVIGKCFANEHQRPTKEGVRSMKIWVARLTLAVSCLLSQQVFAQISIQQAFPGLIFTRPVDLQHAGDGSDRLFVVEQRGVISVFENDPEVTEKMIFLDIQDRVDDSRNEEGLLGLAFHPDYENNGYFYVNYTSSNPNRTRISRFSVTDIDSNAADPNSEQIVMEISKPFSNHNAGQLVFGPDDGYLYITTGDGGSGGDPKNNSQNLQTLLGSILRIDVDNTNPGVNYAVPFDNPFADNSQGYREEIYAFGMRNPWRISFDPLTGWLWAADVGQDTWEEIDIIEKGGNYGWRIMEGLHCFNPPFDCETTGLTTPIWEYDHSLGYSITGGYVYHGQGVPELEGRYIYADYGSGRIWSLEYDGSGPPVNTELLNTSLAISSFGLDQNGELYMCAFNGLIYRFTPTDTGIPGGSSNVLRASEVGQNYPIPLSPTTTIYFNIPGTADTKQYVNITIYDARGRHMRTLADSGLRPGNNRVVWDWRYDSGETVSSGIYFYTLRSGERTFTRKMILLK